jgi:3-(3-hydroxy-phenyl)propionate hydroxylase
VPREERIVSRKVDVLVVGLGPVGAALGCLLGQYGVRTLIIDRATSMNMAPRAIALDNEALRILQLTGLTPDAFETLAVPYVRMVSPSVGEFARFDTSGTVDGHPKLVTFFQPDLERALRRELAEHPCVELRTGVELTGFLDRGDAVQAELRDVSSGAGDSLEAAYIVGADGASSFVRQAIGQEFPGSTYAEDWLVVDVRNAPEPVLGVEFLCDPGRPTPHMAAPGGRQRWEFMLRDGETPAAMERPEAVRALLAPWGPMEAMEIERIAVYRFHARACTSFARGRVFLAGDAAHVMPPFAGQGLVAGLRDAANLAWKLAWVLRSWARPAILESYDQERQPHARHMIALARRLGALIMPSGPLSARLLHAAMLGARKLPGMRPYLDGLGLKPAHRYATGLFATRTQEGTFTPGAWLPQAELRDAEGRALLSDAALGPGLACVGFGCDPEARLDPATRAAFTRHGGRFVQIGARSGILPARPNAYLSGALGPFARAVDAGVIAVVRPDRFVLHDGPIQRSARVVRESLALLDPGASNQPSLLAGNP